MYNIKEKISLRMVVVMNFQLIIILSTLLAFAALGFFLSLSIKRHEANKSKQKKSKGKSKYMPEVKKFGK